MEVPKGYKELENVEGVYISPNEIVITGTPNDGDNHSCDEMGCGSFCHVLMRIER